MLLFCYSAPLNDRLIIPPLTTSTRDLGASAFLRHSTTASDGLPSLRINDYIILACFRKYELKRAYWLALGNEVSMKLSQFKAETEETNAKKQRTNSAMRQQSLGHIVRSTGDVCRGNR